MKVGGVPALVGFLYQLYGAAAMLAGADEFAVLALEENGEDALLRLASEAKLIQFKFSAAGTRIAPDELATILSNLDKHSESSSIGWRLTTNRQFSPAVAMILGETPPNPAILSSVDPDNRSTIERLAPRLERIQVNFGDLEIELSRRAQRYGLSERETEDGIHQLIGAMMMQIRDHGEGVSIGIGFLDAKLVGFNHPGSLHGPDRAAHVAKDLNELAIHHLNGPELDDALPRTALRELFDRTSPVVLVTGPGGSGKTLSVLRAVRDAVLIERLLGAIIISDQSITFSKLVGDWRSPELIIPLEPYEMSLQRLAFANPQLQGWMILLALDGIDERGWRVPDRLNHLREIIRSRLKLYREFAGMHAAPPLIITCRHRRDIDELVGGTGAGGGSRIPYREIELGDFDDGELAELWARWFPDLVFPALSNVEKMELAVVSETAGSVTALDDRVASSLRHPTLLGCFRHLDLQNQRDLLSGDNTAWTALMSGYLDWFTRKVLARHELQQPIVRQMLIAVARATYTRENVMLDRDGDWIRPIVGHVGGENYTAIRVFEDAVSSGLVVTDHGTYRLPERIPVPWRWNFPFVAQHLSALA
jgi:hypothetical protein